MGRRATADSKRGRWVSILVAMLAVTVLAGCTTTGKSSVSAGNGAGDAGAAAVEDISTGLTRWKPADRPKLPGLRGRTLDGRRLDVSDWRGHVVVVNTWGSWCGPCREEAPDLRRASEKSTADGVRFVGINTRDNDAAARAFVREFGIGYPSMIDDDGGLMLAFGQTVPASAVPTTIVVDARGRIAARVIGAVTYATLIGSIDDAQSSPPTESGAGGPSGQP